MPRRLSNFDRLHLQRSNHYALASFFVVPGDQAGGTSKIITVIIAQTTEHHNKGQHIHHVIHTPCLALELDYSTAVPVIVADFLSFLRCVPFPLICGAKVSFRHTERTLK